MSLSASSEAPASTQPAGDIWARGKTRLALSVGTSIADVATELAGAAYWADRRAHLSSTFRRRLLLGTLVVAFLVPGLAGHEPWKQDEGFSFDMILHFIQGSDWRVPLVGGEPFMEKPPLYYWAAAWLARALSAWLPLHDGARLATGLFMVSTVLLLVIAAREAWGEHRGVWAVPVFLGCIGLVPYAHEMITDVALLTGYAASYCGLSLVRRRPNAGAILLGTGLGVGFMSKGLLILAIMGTVALMLPTLFAPWRTRTYLRSLVLASSVLLPWLLIWPVALYLHAPDLFREWFWVNNFGRFFGFANLGAEHNSWHYLRTLPWFACPALPLAAWTLCIRGRGLAQHPQSQLALVTCSAVLGVLWAAATARHLYALPILIPLSILAAGAVTDLPVGLERAWFALNVTLSVFVAAMGWTWWILMRQQGHPPVLPVVSNYLSSEVVPRGAPLATAMALCLTAGALMAFHGLHRRKGSALLSWTVGITLCWGLHSSLALPWIDAAKSYRAPFESLAKVLPARVDCVASLGLGEHERAMLHYFAGLVTQRREVQPDASCSYLLVQHDRTRGRPALRSDQQVVWSGHRLAPAREEFILVRSRRE